jgi:hypothetical protein
VTLPCGPVKTAGHSQNRSARSNAGQLQIESGARREGAPEKW